MKQSTYEKKMAALFGIGEEVIEKVKDERKRKEAKRTGHVQGISEEEIQKFREEQAIIYFFQAPQLFHLQICPRCDQAFVVSRLHVGFCSYPCMQEQIRDELGTNWEKGKDLENLAIDPHVWRGNEPLWIRNLPRLKELLEQLITLADEGKLKNDDEQRKALAIKWESRLSLTKESPKDTPSLSPMEQLAQLANKKAPKKKRKIILS